MNNFINTRICVIWFLILGYAAFTFCFYYQTIFISDIRLFAVPAIHDDGPLIQTIDESSKTNKDVRRSGRSSKNSISLPLKVKSNGENPMSSVFLPISQSSSNTSQRDELSTSNKLSSSISSQRDELSTANKLSSSISSQRDVLSTSNKLSSLISSQRDELPSSISSQRDKLSTSNKLPSSISSQRNELSTSNKLSSLISSERDELSTSNKLSSSISSQRDKLSTSNKLSSLISTQRDELSTSNKLSRSISSQQDELPASNKLLNSKLPDSAMNETKSIVKLSSITNVTQNVSPASNVTIRAIYRFGHDVTVPEKCPDDGKDMELVITVMSAPNNIKARKAIRETWGHFGQRRDMSIVFMSGLTDDVKLEKLLKDEEKLWGDVIRGRYHDSYRNLTLKVISSLEWMNTYCSKAKFMLKTDDDMFINVPRLLNFISNHKKAKNAIYGRLCSKWKPNRSRKSKYYVSRAEYKPSTFPNFTTGPAYLLKSNVIHKLYTTALDQTFFHLEDVFITGMVAEKIGVKRYHAKNFINRKIPFRPCRIQSAISIHEVNYSDQFKLWQQLLDGKTDCNR